MPSDDHWDRFIRGLRSGDDAIVSEFCERYGKHMHAVAERNLATGLRRRIGPESIMQSAYRTFFRRAGEGQFELGDSEDLWRLLCAITVTKVREQARYHRRQKRAYDRESDAGAADDAPRREATAPGPTPPEAAVLAEQFRILLASLDEEEQRIVELKLQEFTNLEVADRLGCSDRTVSRILTRIKDRFEQAFDAA